MNEEHKVFVFFFSYFFKDGRVWKGGAKERDIITCCHWHLNKKESDFQRSLCQRKQSRCTVSEAQYLVENIVGARVDHLDHHVGMEKVRGNHIWYEGSVFFLEHNGHYVVPYVPLSLQLQHRNRQGDWWSNSCQCILKYYWVETGGIDNRKGEHILGKREHS